jgi:NodT family efflux transporter outer membrane factor (OMF) lipoprotein
MLPDSPTLSPRARRVAALLVSAALVAPGAACSRIARHERVDPAVPTTFAHGAVVASEAPLAVDLSTWWTCFEDPELSALIEDALAANHDVRAAVARVREARARQRVAAGARLPEVGVGASTGLSGTSVEEQGGLTLRSAATVDASWEPDVFGRVASGIEAATLDTTAAEVLVHAAQVAVAAEVARQYVGVRGAQEQRALAAEGLALAEELAELATLRFAAGLAREVDAADARAAVERARAALDAVDGALDGSTLALDALLGVAPGATAARLAAPTAPPRAPASLAVGVPADTLRRRPDVRAAQLAAEAARARTDAADAARLPSFRLSGSVGLEALTRVSVGSGAGAAYSLLAGMTAPLFAGGRLRAQVRQQDAAAEQAWIAYEESVNSALIDVERALVALRTAQDREAAQQVLVAHALDVVALREREYGAGVTDDRPVLAARQARVAAERDLASARLDETLAVIQLFGALGGGWPAPDTTASEPQPR